MAAKNYNLNFEGYWRARNKSGLPAQSGIYCVYASTYNAGNDTVNLNRLLYIGEADDVRLRIAGHERWTDWEKKLQVGEELCFSAALVSPMTDRQRAEAAMINHSKPPCNIEYVNSFPFDTTSIMTGGKNAELANSFTVYGSEVSGLAAALIGNRARW